MAPREPVAEPVVKSRQYEEPVRRRRVVVGLAAEAEAQAERRRSGSKQGVARRGGEGPAERALAGTGQAETSQNGLPAPRRGAGLVRQGTCPCGVPASTNCAGGCGRATCGEHLLNRGSRLSWPGPYKSEREHTAYLRGFWSAAGPLCAWCREGAGKAALAALPPVEPLPGGLMERLVVLLRHRHDYPADAWEQTLRQYGGAAAVIAALAPRLSGRVTQRFEGRRRGEVLSGVSVSRPNAQSSYELVDAAGAVWTVRPLGSGMRRKRRVWAWDRTPDQRLAELLPRVLEMAATAPPRR